MSAPRVLLSGVVLDQPMGGVRRHAAEVLPRAARALAEEGGELVLALGTRPAELELRAPIQTVATRVPPRPIALRATLEGRELRRLLRQAGPHPFDLVHTGHLPAPRRLGVPLVLLLHDLRALELEHTPMSRRLVARSVLARALGDAAVVVTVSADVRSKLVTRFGIDPGRVQVVPHGCDHFEPLERVPEPDYLLHVGHLDPRKNLGLLVRALARNPGLPRLVLAGASARGEAERLLRLASELGVAGRVEWRGAFDDRDLPALYAGAACVVVPSLLEGFGLTALEAMRARAPLAVSSAGALPEVTGGLAPTFAPDDPEALAHAVREARSQGPDAIERAARHAARFTWDATARGLVRAWKRAVSR